MTSIATLVGGLLLLCLSSMYTPQIDILHQKVSATYQRATLTEVLADLRDQYDFKFAYLNNELPTDRLLTCSFQDAPLREVLDIILEDTSLTYQVMNGQIVLTKKPEPAKREAHPEPGADPSLPQRQSSPPDNPPASISTDSPEAGPHPEESVPDREEESRSAASQAEEPRTPGPRPSRLEVQPYSGGPTATGGELTLPRVLAGQPDQESPSREEKEPDESPDQNIPRGPSVSSKISRAIEDGLDYALFDHLPDESPYEESPFHVGIIYPVSSNGTQAGRYVNRFSLHLLVGYSAGLDGLEASAIGNVENDFVDGAQFAGVFNVVKQRISGLQGSGFLNVSGGTLEGAQFAGFLNTHAGSAEGVQGAGFMNVTTDYMRGGQFAGFGNITTRTTDAIQAAGFANIAASELKGVQLAGFGNYAYRVEGAQFAGFANVAADHVQGFQGSGFINLARTVKGVQLAVFNVADSIDGVPIGFLSIVRKNGYRAIEVWGAETLHANVSFKIGVRKFYNIFSFGSQFADANFRYGLGYGIGHVSSLTPTIDWSLDLLAQQIYEENNSIFSQNTRLNLLNTLRLGLFKQFSEHFGLFAAPTLNVFVSEVEGKDGSVGSDLNTPYTFFDRTYDGRTNLRMWVGFQVGLRF